MKVIAITKDGPIVEVKIQRQFPNCFKYQSCCTKDKDFWEKLYSKEQLKQVVKQPFRLKNINHAPEGFENIVINSL